MLDDIKPRPRPPTTATMFWTCALAAARVTDALAARGLALWQEMLAPVDRGRMRSTPPDVPASPPPPGDKAHATADPGPSAEPPKPAAPQAVPAFASYRSDGGHATAQVIVLPR
jgi:hypothetical protein